MADASLLCQQTGEALLLFYVTQFMFVVLFIDLFKSDVCYVNCFTMLTQVYCNLFQRVMLRSTAMCSLSEG